MAKGLKKMVMGTVQLGVDYGINNTAGKPKRDEALRMLNFAYKNGVRVFDTASAYQTAENILGEFAGNKKVKIVTKCNNLSELEESLSVLKRKFVDGALLHEPAGIKNIKFLIEAKKKGLAKNIGVSVYNPKDALTAAKKKEIDYIQVPYNIFDQRLDGTNFFELAKKNNKKVFARSVFLQGLLLMPGSKIPDHSKAVKKYLHKFDEIVFRHGFSRKQAALLFLVDNENIDYVVFGADSREQIKELVLIAKSKKNFKNCAEELRKEFKDVPEYIISPNLWENKKDKKLGIIIQARMGSTRLPGKALKQIEDKTVLEHVIERLSPLNKDKKIIVATTCKRADDAIEKTSKKCNALVFRGSENNVLDRFYKAAKVFDVDPIVRITADCPLMDSEVVEKTIKFYFKNNFDYVSNSHPPTYPDGMDVEVFSFRTLEKIWKSAKKTEDKGHVTLYIFRNLSKFKTGNLPGKDSYYDLRLSLDEPADLVLIKKIYKNLYKKNKRFGLKEIVRLLKQKPELLLINKKVNPHSISRWQKNQKKL